MKTFLFKILGYVTRFVPKDKLMHLAGGIACTLLTFGVWSLVTLVPLFAAHPVAAALSVAGITLGAVKEALDRLDNLIMYHMGAADMHGVEWMDFIATSIGAISVSVGLVALGWL